MALAVRQNEVAGTIRDTRTDRPAVRPHRHRRIRQMRELDRRDRGALIDDVAVELLVDGPADAVRPGRQPLDEAPRHAIDGAVDHDIDQVFQPVLRQHRDVLDHAERLDAPPGFDLVLHIVEQRRALAVAARQQDHLVGLGRLVRCRQSRPYRCRY